MTNLPRPLRDRLGRRAPAGARAGHRVGQRRRRHGQVPVGARRRQPDRDRADAVPRPGHGVRVAARPAAPWPAGSAPPGRPGSPATSPPARSSSRSCGPPAGPATVGRRVSNVVFMGMGEPMANEAAVWACGRAAPRRPRPVGPPHHDLDRRDRAGHPAPRRRDRCRSTLAVSACTPPTTSCATSWCRSTGATRSTTLIDACADYLAVKHRRLSFEWAMIDGVNDRPSRRRRAGRAVPAAAPARPRQPDPAQPDARASRRRARPLSGSHAFRDLLEALGVNATVRRNRGTDIDAACGQLAASRRR